MNEASGRIKFYCKFSISYKGNEIFKLDLLTSCKYRFLKRIQMSLGL